MHNRLPTATNKFEDLRPFTKSRSEAVEICDFSTFIQAIGKVHYLAANPKERHDGHAKNDKKYRVFYRGQTQLFGKNRDSIVPSAYRGKSLSQKGIVASVAHLKELRPFVDSDISDEAIEGLMQQYGATSRWIDVVDNIWVALWFACHRLWISRDESATGKAKKYIRSQITYCHYDRRDPFREPCARRFAYNVLLGVEEELVLKSPGLYTSDRDELLNLRQALPSQFIRPHVQHGWLIRRKKDDDYAHDLKAMIQGVIKIPLSVALSWLGDSRAFEVSSMFPPPCFDTGWRDLSFRDACSEKRVFNQIICS